MESNHWKHKGKGQQRNRRCPDRNLLYRLAYHYRDKLQWCWEEQFESEFGVLHGAVLKSRDKYLACGILVQGCASSARCKLSETSARWELAEATPPQFAMAT